jgi:hypothetical protein
MRNYRLSDLVSAFLTLFLTLDDIGPAASFIPIEA